MRRLDDAHWEVRAEAAEATGRIGLVGIMARLVALLSDENWWVRFLGRHGARGARRARDGAAPAGRGRQCGRVRRDRVR